MSIDTEWVLPTQRNQSINHQ